MYVVPTRCFRGSFRSESAPVRGGYRTLRSRKIAASSGMVPWLVAGILVLSLMVVDSEGAKKKSSKIGGERHRAGVEVGVAEGQNHNSWERRPPPFVHDRLLNSILNKANEDPFHTMTVDERRKDFFFQEDATLKQLIQQASDVELPISVNVKLVGFEENSDLPLSEKELIPFLDAVSDGGFVVVQPPESEKSSEGEKLLVRKKYVFTVTKARSILTKQITEAINSFAPEEFNDDSILTSIPFSKVDALIHEDYKVNEHGYTIYILNPDTGEFGYTYIHPGAPVEHCTINNFVGEKSRYLWLDIKADASEKEPPTLEEGATSVNEVPHWHRYSYQDPKLRKQSLSIDISNLVKRTCDYLIAPPLHHFPLHIPQNFVLDFTIIHDHPIWEKDAFGKFDVNEIGNRLSELFGSLPGYSAPTIRKSDVSLIENEAIATVFKNSLKSYHSNVRGDEVDPHSFLYLDSSLLHYWFNHYKYSIGTFRPGSLGEKVIPIYIFDFTYTDILLLDKNHQSVAFPDMVIAIQVANDIADDDFTGFWCEEHPIHIDRTVATRPVLASLLQTIWGMSKTYSIWNPLRMQFDQDLTWVSSNTPFGFFTTSTQLSFAIRDAAPRHQIYELLNSTAADLLYSLTKFEVFQKELYNVLESDEYEMFLTRFNILQYKMKQATTFLSVNSFTSSYLFVKSCRFDLNAISEVIHLAVSRLHTKLICNDDVEVSTFWFNVLIGPVMSIAVVLSAFIMLKPKSKSKRT